MDWNKTKTIFIITFLILDVFLGFQLIDKRNSSQVDILEIASIEEMLEAEEITYDQLPEDSKEGSYVTAKTKIFTEEDTRELKNQEVNIETPGMLSSTLTKPIKITEGNMASKVQQFLKEYILSGDSYSFWKYNREAKTIVLFQHYKNKVVYNNIGNVSGLLLVSLNDQFEISSYKQTMLVDFEEYKKEEIIPALRALENLLNNGHLPPGSNVTKVELGYYPLVQKTESQYLAPAWHIVVDDKTDLYVNAFEGQILEVME